MFWKLYWKGLAAAGLFILCLVAFAWASTTDANLWKEVKQQILAEEYQIQEQLTTQVAQLEQEKQALTVNLEQLRQERAMLLQKYTALEGKKNELQRQLAAITVPDNPDDIVAEFHKAGIRSAKRR